MGKFYSDTLFRGHVMQALLTCSPEVFRYLWMSYSDQQLCSLNSCRRIMRDPYYSENRPDPEVIELIIGQRLRW
ncbi:hypothetical protein [Methanocella sp. MCL-LM]|uniref:hypothetical protein n=1 Tax=Methanocella sp. MCL-LM TaxID=3412035 RepID=UPI003C73E5D8